MEKIVEKIVEMIEGKPMTTSVIVAKKFGREHRDVLRAIVNLDCSDDFRLRNFTQSSYVNKQNREMPMYLMTRDGFTFLCMGFTGDKAAKWKEAYIKAFNMMEDRLTQQNEALEWKQARLQGKAARKSVTDAIQRFVDYATNQGSKNASRYYSNITKMEYAALDLISQRETVPSNFRDTLDALDLAFLTTAEYIAKAAIEQGMTAGMDYKDIYTLAKQHVMRFADTVRITRIGETRINHPDLPKLK